MRKKILLLILMPVIMIIYSCSKGGGNSPDPCSGITVAVTGTITDVTATGATNGAINASATGGTGFTYSINNGLFQSSGNFTNLAAGTYTVTAKNSNGCTGSAQFTVTTNNNCTGVTINLSTTVTNTVPCQSPSGSITASATGSTGFTYSIDGTNFQSTGNFINLAAGAYIVTVKDVNGCTATGNVSVQNQSAGALFSAVRTLLQNNCVSCHNNTQAEGGMNWTVDCNIINNQDRIKARAVDNNPSSMPPTGPLSQGDKNKITDWINAGGKYTN